MTNLNSANDVLQLQLLSYKVEADLIGFYEIPPLKDTIESLQQCGETFFGYYIDNELGGAISYKNENGELDIHRLMVHPNHFRKGIAGELLQYIQTNEVGFETIIVATGSKNAPAVKFYQYNGFQITEERTVAEGVSLTFFKKTMQK